MLKKTVRIGTMKIAGRANASSIFCFIEITDDGRLSITGVEGPFASGNCAGGCGQIHDSIAEGIAEIEEYAPGWTRALTLGFVDVWKYWHLNHSRAGCRHQRSFGWDKRRIDDTKPSNAYGKHFPGQRYDSWNLLSWVRPGEHPDGLLTAPCPVCGYRYGTKWLKEELPLDIIDYLGSLPDADYLPPPAWQQH